jgi:hypothetical protein
MKLRESVGLHPPLAGLFGRLFDSSPFVSDLILNTSYLMFDHYGSVTISFPATVAIAR